VALELILILKLPIKGRAEKSL